MIMPRLGDLFFRDAAAPGRAAGWIDHAAERLAIPPGVVEELAGEPVPRDRAGAFPVAPPPAVDDDWFRAAPEPPDDDLEEAPPEHS
jgi:hypothetical protein